MYPYQIISNLSSNNWCALRWPKWCMKPTRQPPKCGRPWERWVLDVKNVGQHTYIYIYIYIYIYVVTHKHQCLEKDVKIKKCGQLVYNFLMFFMLVYPRHPLAASQPNHWERHAFFTNQLDPRNIVEKVREIHPCNGTSSMDFDGFHSYKPPWFLRISMGHEYRKRS